MSIIVKEHVAPANPAATKHEIYVDSADGKLKKKDSSGTVTDYTPSSGGYDLLIGAGEANTNFADLQTNGVSGDSAYLLTETIASTPTFSKQFGIYGGGSGSVHTGAIVFAVGSDGSILKDIKVDGNITIDATVKNITIMCHVSAGSVITDNGTNNFILVLEEV